MAGSGLVRDEMAEGGVRLIWLSAPPANLFGPALCTALMAALEAALADGETRAVVLASALRGPGQGFSGGMDLAELARPWPQGAPGPGDIARRIMAARCPVIVALHGAVLGAGAEIALAAQARIATADMRFGLRDVLVGRLPMAGATQTLPRLIGAVEALRLIGKGVMVTAVEALAMGIVDAVTEGDLRAGALAMAAAPPAAGRSPGLRDGRGYQAAVAQARAGAGGDAAQRALADCIEAAQLLPLEQGLAFEAEAAADIAARPETAALQHLVAAEMRGVVDLAGGQSAGRIGIWGAAAAPLILPALRAGLDVVVADEDRPALVQAIERVARAQEEAVAAGRLTPALRDAEWARLHPVLQAADLARCDLVIAARAGVGGRVLLYGAAPGQPSGEMPRMVQVAPGLAELQVPRADPAFGRMAAATLRRLRLRLVVTQAPPEAGVARALVLAVQQAVAALLQMGVDRSALVQATEGFMRLPIAKAEASAGSLPMAAEEVRLRLLGALAAEGGRLLMQGAVRRASDIDILALAALGMPRSSGGPLFAADARGLMVVRRDLLLWQKDHPVWQPPGLLDDLFAKGTRLATLDLREAHAGGAGV